MFKNTTKDKRTNLEKEIDSVLDIMSTTQPASDEYKTMTESLEKLYKAKASESERKVKVSPDTIAVGVFGILQLLLIMRYEEARVITTKAFGYVMKGRV